MVLSVLKKEVEYKDTKEIEDDDNDLEAITYDIKLKSIDEKNKYTVVFGKANHTFENKGIIYYPIYLIVDSEVKCQIGVIEFDIKKIPSILDDDGDIHPKYIKHPLLYEFVTKKFINAFNSSDDEKSESDSDNDEDGDEEELTDVTEEDLGIEEINNDIFDVSVPKNPDYTPTKEEQIFEIDINLKQPETLAEETKQDAKEIKELYKESTRNEWIEKFMKNNHYNIIDNEGGGDCLFAVIRDAFEQIGKMTTVETLRKLVSEEVDEDIFNENRNVYLDMENNIQEINKEIKTQNALYKEYKERIKDKQLRESERIEILKQVKEIKDNVKSLTNDKNINQEILKYDFGYMKEIDNINKFKDFIRTNQYWADAWAISVLEYKLNIKLIIFSESAYNENSQDSIINCGDFYKKIQQKGMFTPIAYIMTSYSGEHYRLITYKKKKILTFREIPYDVKSLIINKCLEKNSGTYHLIEDFKNMKKKLGLKDDDSSDDENIIDLDLFDNDTEFVFHSKAQKKAKPGKASGEKIPKNKMIHYKKLEKMTDWRKKLDNSYPAPFMLDNNKWQSVDHYYQGSKFKKGFPDHYLQFSLDSKSDISKNIELAKKEGSRKGTSKNIKIDPDFYGERSVEEKQKAIEAKFEQNEDLKEMLINTYPAKLLHFKRGKPSTLSNDVLKIRKKFMDEK